MPELICKILHISKTTYYSYLKKNYSIVIFLNTLSKEELEELLKTSKIKKFENSDNLIQIHKEAIHIYIDFIQKLNLEEIKSFLNIIFKIKQDLKNTSDIFLDYLLLSGLEMEIKKQIIISINSISNQVLFFYAIDYLSNVRFKDIYPFVNDILEENHLQAYIQSFLNLKEGLNYPNKKDFFKDRRNVELNTVYPEGEYWDLDDIKYEENKSYKNYLYSLVFDKK